MTTLPKPTKPYVLIIWLGSYKKIMCNYMKHYFVIFVYLALSQFLSLSLSHFYYYDRDEKKDFYSLLETCRACMYVMLFLWTGLASCDFDSIYSTCYCYCGVCHAFSMNWPRQLWFWLDDFDSMLFFLWAWIFLLLLKIWASKIYWEKSLRKEILMLLIKKTCVFYW